MYERLLTWLRCPECGGRLQARSRISEATDAGTEITEGVLRCALGHVFQVSGGVPRMLPRAHDRRTRDSFDREWSFYRPGDRTWASDLDERVDTFLRRAIRLSGAALEGKLLLDAGCGNGSQSVAYTELGLEVVAVDLSTGVDHGHAFRHRRPAAQPHRVHFVQADLQAPPFAPGTFDLIHSVGVLHQTTRLPPRLFAVIARALAVPFQLFTMALDASGLRRYRRLDRREAALALMDIFGAPHAHHHSFGEVDRWYRSEGFDEVWRCNDSRGGFGACGRRAAA